VSGTEIDRIPPGQVDRQVRALRTEARRISAPGFSPEWVMFGVDVPAGKRLYASRELSQAEISVWDSGQSLAAADGWHVDANMRNVLVITRDTYAEALAELMVIWANHDRAAAEDGNGSARRHIPAADRARIARGAV
jgi:hypothetical protein